eukprot:3434584-Pyramimonas_sp.AAC.1
MTSEPVASVELMTSCTRCAWLMPSRSSCRTSLKHVANNELNITLVRQNVTWPGEGPARAPK